jgi:hypothetical protein
MVLKSGRFELRLDESTLEKIDVWRSNQTDSPSRSEAVRKLVAAGLSRDTAEQLFQVARFNVLCAARTQGVGEVLSDAYVYAWAEGVFPFFDSNNERFHLAFASHFDVSEEMVDELAKLLDDREREKKYHHFMNLKIIIVCVGMAANGIECL